MTQKNLKNENIWFPAKPYGLGWGAPVAWQGWMVLVSYLMLLLGGTVWLMHTDRIGYYLLYVFTITAILFLICFIKGERLG